MTIAMWHNARVDTPLARKLDQVMQSLGITTGEELAGRIGISPAALSRHRNGVRAPDTETVQKYAAFLGITTDEVLALVPATESEARAWASAGRFSTRLPQNAQKALETFDWEGVVAMEENAIVMFLGLVDRPDEHSIQDWTDKITKLVGVLRT